MTTMSLVSLYLIRVIDNSQLAPLWVVMVVIFIVAWIGQFVGHKHEGKKPSFFEDLQYLMIGPAWTMSHLFDRIGVRFWLMTNDVYVAKDGNSGDYVVSIAAENRMD